MASVFIERVPVQFLGLGLFGFDHLQLVYQPSGLEGDLQDNWFVMEGVRDLAVTGAVIGVDGADGITTLSEANQGKTGSELVDAIGTPQVRGSREVVGTANALSAWNAMATFATDLDQQGLPYTALSPGLIAVPTINSSSVIATLLYHIGADISQYMPSGLRFSPGWKTLLGTSGADTLQIEGSFDTIVGGGGNDILTGSTALSTVDKLYGGTGEDRFIWTQGSNVYHGGQTGLDYAADGIDTVDYSGVGTVRLEFNAYYIPHMTATFYAHHATGTDHLLSIEAIEWNEQSDTVELGEGVNLINDNVRLNLGNQSNAGQGDRVDFSTATSGLLFNAASDGSVVVQSNTPGDLGAGLFFQSAEWIAGSTGADRVYLAPGVRGAEGGAGDDLLDARLVTAHSGQSPLGYDSELLGGAGNDTLVSGTGRTLAQGGEGADRFVLSALTPFGALGLTEFVIEGAGAEDRLFISYGLIDGTFAGFDTSPLLPLLGAISQIPGEADFAHLPQNLGPWSGGPDPRSDFFSFQWQLQDDIFFGSDQTDGVINFAGDILYNRDGDDLLIHVFLGVPFEITEEGGDGNPWTHTVIFTFPETETVIRVKDFQEGLLGIEFHDPGTPTVVDVETDHGPATFLSYPNWDSAVLTLTNNGVLEPGLAPRPDAPVYVPPSPAPGEELPLVSGTAGDDTIVLTSGAARIEAGAGNDSLEGSAGDDVLDGGTGNDVMTGGAGRDLYLTDSQADVIVEASSGGRDRVLSSSSYILSDFVEDLELAGSAISGTGNGLANRIIGNSSANILNGLGGNDQIFGGAGADQLLGGDGSDSYVYALGDGDDVVIDGGSDLDTDTLALMGVSSEAISLFRLASQPQHLIIKLPDGARITIENFGSVPGAGIERIDFELGAAWELAELQSRAASAPLLLNDTPHAADDTSFGVSSGTVVIPASALLANDRDLDGDTLTIVAISNVSAGANVSLTPGGDISITTPAGFDGTVSFDYTISDGNGGTSTAFVELGVIPNHAPTVSGAIPPQSSAEDEPWSYTVPATLFADPEGGSLAFSAQLAGGTALPGWLTFDSSALTFNGTPPSNFHGLLNIEVVASDGLARTAAPFTLEILSVNDAPTASADGVFETVQDTSVTILASALLGNDLDADGDTLAILSVQDAVNGTVVLNTAGDAIFTPGPGYQGPASFSYTVSDGKGGTATAGVAIQVGTASGGLTIIGTGLSETLIGSNGADTIEGRGGNDIMSALGGNDVFLIAGNDGLDTFDGGDGLDTIKGSAGNDTIGLIAGTLSLVSVEVIDAGAGTDVLRLTASADNLDLSNLSVSGLEEIRGLGGNDTIIGSAADDVINGGGGNDALAGSGGNDTFLAITNNGYDDFDGGVGFDRIVGGAGDDLIGLLKGSSSLISIEEIDGGAGYDVLRLTATNDVLDLSRLAVTGIEEVRGLGGNDAITGTSFSDVINGGSGNDTLSGGDGSDTFLVSGSSGLDDFDGGEGFDQILGSSANDTIGLARGSLSLAGVERIDGGAGTDTLRLSIGNDILDLSGVAMTGVEFISALAGNDTIIASAASETIRGGGGMDTFVFKIGSGHDVIADFQRGTIANPILDVIDLSAFHFSGFNDLMSHAVLSGADTLISIDAETSLRILNLAPGQLKADDFILA